jgi:hypothetical protein
MLFAWAQKKKTHDFINRKGSLDKKNLVEFWAKLPTKTGIGWKNQEILSRTRTGSILRCNSPSDCVEAFDHVCPPVSLGWVIVGGWTKIADRLEGPSPEVFLSVCSSKLEASQAFVQRLQLFFKMGAETSTFFYLQCFLLKIGCCRLIGDPPFILVHAWKNVWTCNLYDELALRGVTYDRHFCMMKQEYWFLLKLYNENFWSDDHFVTHKSWIQDASRRVRPDANKW